MKQESNFKVYTPQPNINKKQNHITTLTLQSSINPEVEKNNSTDQTIYCNPAVHLKKNFLKFTKAASITSSENNNFQAKKQQRGTKQQQNIMLANSINESMRFLREEKRILQQKIQFIENQNKNKEASLVQKNEQFNELVIKLNLMQRQIYNLRQNESKLSSLVNYYKFAPLRCEKCKQADQNYKYLQQKYVEICERSKKLQQILQSKDLMFQTTIKSKNDQYKSALASKNNEIKSLDMRILVLQNENQRLYSQLSRPTLMKEDQSISKLQKMGAQFQLRIGEFVDENIKFKNTINHLQGKVEQLTSKNQSLQNTIKAYEGCEELYNGSKTKSQLETMRVKLEVAKEEYDRMASKYQFEILRLQNMIAQKRMEEQSLLSFSDKERLRQALMSAIWEIQALKGRSIEMK